MPVVDGIRLADLIADSEVQSSYTPAGGYAGLVLQNFGPLEKYLVGNVAERSLWKEGVYLLGCTCGEVGCWPLQCEVIATEETVVWRRFQQPHRRERDYRNFGPFTFDRKQYTTAVSVVAEKLGT